MLRPPGPATPIPEVDGIALVEFVATLPGAAGEGLRGDGHQAAALTDPTRPAFLIASDLGRPVYERLGLLATSRWTLWIRQ